MHSSSQCRRGVSRRDFLVASAGFVAAGAPLAYLYSDEALLHLRRFAQSVDGSLNEQAKKTAEKAYLMPGRHRGKVVEVQHPDAVRPDNTINAPAVDAMIDQGMIALSGAGHPHEAWGSFFEKSDIIGIKVNPVGRKAKTGEGGRVSGAVGAISSPEVLLKVVSSLKDIGVPAKNIIVFERYANEFCDAGYDQVMFERVMDGVRWFASGSGYGIQLDVTGFDGGRSGVSPELAKHVVGYDPDVFVNMGFAAPGTDKRDDRRFRSHLSMIVSRMVNKFITLPVLKDHRSAGVTLSLKNMSHGMNNNVARSHISGIRREAVQAGDGSAYAAAFTVESGPNQCNTFIPTAVNQHRMRQKATLHILDGLIGVYEGGPGSWNQTWATWRRKSLFFATDPVALDLVGWKILDAKRAAEGWPSVANMGLLNHTDSWRISTTLAGLAAAPPLAAAMTQAVSQNRLGGSQTEIFDRRTPEHVILAGTLDLGDFDPATIHHRRIHMTA